MKQNRFPEGFLWGASSSAFQIEGGWDADGKGMTVADYNSFRKSAQQADTKIASDFYHHWREDIALMKELGMKAYRFSVAWSRIVPDGDGAVNEAGVAFYRAVIEELVKNGIEPLVTLYHFDLPYALVEKYNGWENRACAYAYERFARVCFGAFGDLVQRWQTHNEQNLMMRVDERMNIRIPAGHDAERMRAQMDYHMFLANALAIRACRELLPQAGIGPAISATVTYPYSNKPEDVWAARMNNYFKTDYALDMYYNGKYSGIYANYLREMELEPRTEPGDAALLAAAKPDFLAVNYYRTLCARYLPADAEHACGTRGGNEIDYDQYGWWKIERNENLAVTAYGAQIDPMGLRIVLNDYYARYHVPLIITENLNQTRFLALRILTIEFTT